MDHTVSGILQARILEWEPCPSPEDLPNPGIKPRPPALQADSLPAEPQAKPQKPVGHVNYSHICVIGVQEGEKKEKE